jgi:hypothetical protein
MATEEAQPKKGPNRGNAGKGRPKGTPNKVTATVKDMIIQAVNELGGVSYLVDCGNENRAAFLALVGRIVPLQVAGDPDNPLKTELVVRYRLPDNGR